MAEIEEVIAIGDRLRFSVALVETIDRLPAHQTVVLIVTAIESEPDGAKVVHLMRDGETRNTIS